MALLPAAAWVSAHGKAFQDDPEWQKVRDASEINGKLVDEVDSTYMALTDFSPGLQTPFCNEWCFHRNSIGK
jgi:hypothetical protein